MKRGKISAWISTDHDILPESEAIQEKGYATCWVPSKAGAPFRIGYTAVNCTLGLKVTVYIDGELAAIQTHAPSKKSQRALQDGIRSRQDSLGLERPFLFQERNITDNDMDTVSEACLSHLGSIKVVFSWIIPDLNSLSNKPCSRLEAPVSHHSPVYEGCVKRRSSAVAHAAGLGAIRRFSPSWISQKYSKLARWPYVGAKKTTLRPLRWANTGLRRTTFEFKYAPEEYLSTAGILRRQQPPKAQVHSMFAQSLPWRSHVGTPYRELHADFSLSGISPAQPVSRFNLHSRDTGLDFNTPVKLGKHTVTNFTPLAKLGKHMIAHPVRLSPLIKVQPILKQETETGNDSIVEISASDFYKREVIDLTGLDSDSD
ncbi:unnamed protein product [Rhizoctonia solani]|uniref:Uncharacterized protein n=1 Tax=Rhizoctonia solani TaxID=456999 RepID=A0A8H3H1A5_9AGAM|nr:unnamed protein product [Rhizoctonia solani]CAE6475356.1 unnamed protein product [Rhizoctonia solani]